MVRQRPLIAVDVRCATYDTAKKIKNLVLAGHTQRRAPVSRRRPQNNAVIARLLLQLDAKRHKGERGEAKVLFSPRMRAGRRGRWVLMETESLFLALTRFSHILVKVSFLSFVPFLMCGALADGVDIAYKATD